MSGPPADSQRPPAARPVRRVLPVRPGGRHTHGVAVVGLPLAVDGHLFNCAAVFHAGKLLGVIPKSYLPNYKEFYDARYFSPAANAVSRGVRVAGQAAPFGTDLLFACGNLPDFILGIEICEDLWTPVP